MTYDFAEIERKKGKEEGEIKGKIEILVQMIKKGFINLQQASEQMGITQDKFNKLAFEYGLI